MSQKSHVTWQAVEWLPRLVVCWSQLSNLYKAAKVIQQERTAVRECWSRLRCLLNFNIRMCLDLLFLHILSHGYKLQLVNIFCKKKTKQKSSSKIFNFKDISVKHWQEHAGKSHLPTSHLFDNMNTRQALDNDLFYHLLQPCPYLRMCPPLMIIISLSSTTRDDGGWLETTPSWSEAPPQTAL